MNPALPEVAAEFAGTADKALVAAGGVDLARRAEADPAGVRAEVAGLLDGLGLGQFGFDTGDETEAAAAAELCRVGGRYVVPYPVAAVVAGGGQPAALAGARSRVDHGDLFPAWTVLRLDGRAEQAAPAGAPLGSELGPFVVDMEATGEAAPQPGLVARLLTLSAFRVLGALERALELAVDHVRDRHQFGQALARFQAVQFQLADASVAVEGLRQLSRYTLWKVLSDPAGLTDPLALRLHACDTARLVLRTTQQLFGAAGLCDEYDISLLVRHIQPELRLPFGAERTASLLFESVEREGFDSLFPHGARTAGGP